ncbi:MAG: hypothetical protein R2881_02690 [Eubacteriales bacterium]
MKYTSSGAFGIEITVHGPTNVSTGREAMSVPSAMKCSGASTCVPKRASLPQGARL